MSQKKESNTNNVRYIVQRITGHETFPLAMVLVALIGGMGIATKGLSIRATNISNVIVQSSMRGLAATGQSFVILAGGIDLSVGGMALFCINLGALLLTRSWQNLVGHPIPVSLAVLVMMLVGIAWGVLNGSLVSRVGIPALIVTLGMWQITTGAAFRLTHAHTVGELPGHLAFFGRGVIAGVPVPIIIFIVTVVVSYFVLNYTSYGRSVYTVGGNPVSAWLSGINVKRIRFSVYMISGFMAALAALIALGCTMVASMTAMQGLEIDSIAAATVGGVSLAGGIGNIICVLLGTMIIGVVNNAMSISGADPAIVGMVKGMIIIAAVTVDYVRRR